MSLLRRTPVRLFILICALLALFWTLDLSWELPSSWKDAGILTSSRAKIQEALRTKNQPKVDEIYGLLHLVTAGSDEYQHVLTNNVELDPTTPIRLDVYAAGNKNLDWEAEVARLEREFPVIVFSKTFCPFSKKVKELLATYDLSPPPKIIEVDIRDESAAIKAILTRLTQHSTFPNVLVRGESLGGSDKLQILHENKELAEILEKSGVVVRNKNIR